MYAVISQSESISHAASPQRASGEGRVSFKASSAGATKLDRLYQQGCAKIRLPKVYGTKAAEAVLINSSGGLTGGDQMHWTVTCNQDTHGVATTQACEKLYKSSGGRASVINRIDVEDGARLDWLPQETILFNRSGLARKLDVNLAKTSRFLAVEAVLLGRIAMGEQVHHVDFSDSWTIRKEGKLVHADAIRLQGNIAEAGTSQATLGGALAFASLCYIGPEDKETFEHLAQGARSILSRSQACSGGVSTFNGKLLVRLTAPQGIQLRQALIPIIDHLRAGEPLPRVWTT